MTAWIEARVRSPMSSTWRSAASTSAITDRDVRAAVLAGVQEPGRVVAGHRAGVRGDGEADAGRVVVGAAMWIVRGEG